MANAEPAPGDRHVCAALSDRMASTVLTWGNRGGSMLPDVIGVRLSVFVAVFVPLIVAGLYLLERFGR